MKVVFDFLASNPMLAIFLCLALGFCIGLIRIRSFAFGATIGTLLVGFVMSRFVTFSIPGLLVSIFSVLFCFTIGYEAGPAFFKSLKSNGIKFVVQAVFFCSVSFLGLYLLGVFGVLDRDSAVGMTAGALTQTSVLTAVDGLGDDASITYAVTYIFGMLIAILFATVIGPMLLRTDLPSAVKQKLAKTGSSLQTNDENGDVRISAVYPRAYLVTKGSSHIGSTVEALEDTFAHTLQVVMLFRDGTPVELTQETVIQCDDVLTLISPTKHLVSIDDEFLVEVSDSKYTSIEPVSKEIVVTEELEEGVVDYLSRYGIVLQTLTQKGKRVKVTEETRIQKGAVLKVSGVASAVKKVADKLGYIKEIGNTTSIPFMFFALAGAVLLGVAKIGGYSFGESTCALIIGLGCGWYNNRQPKTGKFPPSARWFLKSVGLNLFIAVKALTTGSFALDAKILTLIGVGIGVTLVPHILTLLLAKYVLKMDHADILGGQCGSGTCTAALNALTDSTGSSVFSASFATTNAISSILLTVVGVLLASLL